MAETAPPDTTAGRPYGGQSPDVRRAERRQRLLDAGLELYGTVGYRGTSVAMLCRQAKVAPAKFYEEFLSQEELLRELCTQMVAAESAAVLAAVAEAPVDIYARCRAGIGAYCHALLDDDRRARIQFVEGSGVSAAAEATRRALLGGFGGLILGQFGSFGVDTAPDTAAGARSRVVATGLVGAVHEAIVHRLFEAAPIPIEDFIDILTGIFVAVGTWLVAPPSPFPEVDRREDLDRRATKTERRSSDF